MRRPPATVRQLALFRALYLGDLLVAVPAIRALRQRYPNAEITLIGLPWARDFVYRYRPLIDRFESFPGFPGLRERAWDAREVARFLTTAQARQYDLAIQLHGDGRISNLFVALLGARWTVGYRPAGTMAEQAPLDATLEWPSGEHQIHRWLRLVRLADATATDPTPTFPITSSDRAEIAMLGLTGPLAVVHPGARAPARRWPPPSFAALADRLAREFGLRVVLVGGREDAVITNAVARAMHTPAIDLAGQISLGGLAALLERAAIFIGNDSGPAHLAIAVGTPSVTIFTSVDPAEWGPLDRTCHRVIVREVGCNPCGYDTCPIDHRCATAIRPGDVLAAIADLLEATPSQTVAERNLDSLRHHRNA